MTLLATLTSPSWSARKPRNLSTSIVPRPRRPDTVKRRTRNLDRTAAVVATEVTRTIVTPAEATDATEVAIGIVIHGDRTATAVRGLIEIIATGPADLLFPTLVPTGAEVVVVAVAVAVVAELPVVVVVVVVEVVGSTVDLLLRPWPAMDLTCNAEDLRYLRRLRIEEVAGAPWLPLTALTAELGRIVVVEALLLRAHTTTAVMIDRCTRRYAKFPCTFPCTFLCTFLSAGSEERWPVSMDHSSVHRQRQSGRRTQQESVVVAALEQLDFILRPATTAAAATIVLRKFAVWLRWRRRIVKLRRPE